MNRRTSTLVTCGGAVMALAAAGLTGVAHARPAEPGTAGFHTSQASMLAGRSGTSVSPLLSVGDTVSGYTFESLPDGIAVSRVNGRGTMDVLVNHETSKVAFPLPTPTQAGRQDVTNALLSRVRLSQQSAGVLNGEYVIPSSAGYQRFCSSYLNGAAEGFEKPLLLTVEEARDIVRREEDSWPVVAGDPANEQAGVVVAYDPRSGDYRSIYGMGRHNHENAVGVRGYGHPVVLSGDDTFDAPASQMYLYSAANGADVWDDEGSLFAFKSDVAAVNDYGDLSEGQKVAGSFIPVPREIATGKKDGRDITSADYPGIPAPGPGIPDGPQWVLEQWSNANGVFQFIRIEDLAPSRTAERVIYFADTGEPRAVADPTTGRLRRAPSGTRGLYPNGRLFKMTLGATPTSGTELELVADFDKGGYNNAGEVHQPDNVETTAGGVYLTEDPGSHNQASASFPNATNARVWRIDLATGARTVVAEIDQTSGPGTLPRGSWETAGIIDVSDVFGSGAFLINVQAHGWDDVVGPGTAPGVEARREHGQLLLIRVLNP